MNEEPSTAGANQGLTDSPSPSAPRSRFPVHLPARLRGSPSRGIPELFHAWLPYVALALVPAIIVGVLVFALKGGGGTDRAAGVIDGFIRLGPSEEGTVQSFAGKLPPGFPADFPRYAGAKVVVSFLIQSQQGSNYFAILGTSDAPERVLSFYQDRLDKDPWQVEIARASDEFSGLRFSRPDNADVEGDVSVHRSDLDART